MVPTFVLDRISQCKEVGLFRLGQGDCSALAVFANDRLWLRWRDRNGDSWAVLLAPPGLVPILSGEEQRLGGATAARLIANSACGSDYRGVRLCPRWSEERKRERLREAADTRRREKLTRPPVPCSGAAEYRQGGRS